MAATFSSGSSQGIRKGGDPVIQTLPITFNDTTAFKAISIPASVTKPVMFTMSFSYATAFTATTPQISIGTTSLANQIVALVAPGTVGQNLALTQLIGFFTTDTDIYLKFTNAGGANTAGLGYVNIQLWTANTQAI